MEVSKDETFESSSYREVHEMLDEVSTAAEDVLESNGVFDYNSSWDIEEEILSYKWKDGRKVSGVFFGVLGDKVHVTGYTDKPNYIEHEIHPVGIVGLDEIERNMKFMYGLLEDQ